MHDAQATVLIFRTDGLGSTDVTDLPPRLAATFLRLLREGDMRPKAICFYTDGVRLACTGSAVLEPLRALEAEGVRLILCSTCLETLRLRDQVQVGIVGGMGDILTAMWEADKVVSL
jgi:hypothetical protein